jgi:hypothetical protein
MPLGMQTPETDLWVPRPEPGEHWDPHTIHTHYFGFSVADAELGAFIYIRWQPEFPLCGAGVCIFRGMDNVCLLDMDYLDYEVTMPWPEVEGNRITTRNGLQVEFLEPGVRARVSYKSADGFCDFDMIQSAISPLLARGHVMPGEEEHHDDISRQPGGSEQFMRVEGELRLEGQSYSLDPYAIRDRSWSQVRTERRGAVDSPPVGWSPMCFDDRLMLNQIGFEPVDTDPAWKGLYEIPADAPTHHWGWLIDDGEPQLITRVRRNVLEYHPRLHAATRQELELDAEDGRSYRFTGEAYTIAAVPAWPNLAAAIGVYRWEDEQGRSSDQTYQEVAFDRYHREMTRRARLARA